MARAHEAYQNKHGINCNPEILMTPPNAETFLRPELENAEMATNTPPVNDNIDKVTPSLSQACSTRASDAAQAQAAACEVIASSDAAKGEGKRAHAGEKALAGKVSGDKALAGKCGALAGKCGQAAYGEA